jgi:hypothetical protein
VALLPLDAMEAESRFQEACADTPSPDRAYDRTWVLTLLDVVLQRLRAEVAQTLARPEKVEEELAALMAAFVD